MQGANNVLPWLPNLNPRGSMKPRVRGSPLVWGCLSGSLDEVDVEKATPLSGLMIFRVGPGCETRSCTPSQADLSMVYVFIHLRPFQWCHSHSVPHSAPMSAGVLCLFLFYFIFYFFVYFSLLLVLFY